MKYQIAELGLGKAFLGHFQENLVRALGYKSISETGQFKGVKRKLFTLA